MKKAKNQVLPPFKIFSRHCHPLLTANRPPAPAMGFTAGHATVDRRRNRYTIETTKAFAPMNKFNPKDDDLERAFQSALRGQEGYPELFRQLHAGRLFFLVPHHPENEGEKEITNRDRVPLVKVRGPDGKEYVPVYTKKRHAHHAMKDLNQRFDIVEMLGREMFAVLANHRVQVALNARSGLGQIRMNETTVARIADASILHLPEGPRQHGQVQIVDPADYPTAMVQPLFQFLRGCADVRAAWIFRQVAPDPPEIPCYVFGLLMPAENRAVMEDFSTICATSRPKHTEFGVFKIDLAEPALAALLKQHPPFFAAPNFHWPESLATNPAA
jgi:SseB protein C-terminal domain/SseB protein N-terminal domain